MNTFFSQFLWVIFPYIMMTTFSVGHIYRYNKDQFGWSAKSSEFLEKRTLKWGSPLFHWGILAAFFGHVAGIIIPLGFYNFLAVPDHLYHFGAVWIGGIAGIVSLVGILIILYRRVNFQRIRLHVTKMDWVIGFLLLIIIAEGVYVTVIANNVIGRFDYRSTIGPWFRSLFSFTPDPRYMVDVPFSFKLHILSAFLLFGLWPFSRLVHFWSLPLEYFNRSYIVYRSRNFSRVYESLKRPREQE